MSSKQCSEWTTNLCHCGKHKLVLRTRQTPATTILLLTCFGRVFCPSSEVQDCIYSNRHLSNRYCCLLVNKQSAVSVWPMPVAVYTALNFWWGTEKPSETCRVSFQNKINVDTLVHLVGFTIKINITMHGPMKVKITESNITEISDICLYQYQNLQSKYLSFSVSNLNP